MIIEESPERGVALVELSIIIFVLLVFITAGFEFASALQQHERASMLSRQAAASAYRQCSAEVDSTAAESCLQGVVEHFEDFVAEALPGMEVIISMYRHDHEDLSCPLAFQAFSIVGGDHFRSRISAFSQGTSRSNEQTISADMVCTQRVVVAAEVFVPYRGLIPAAAVWFNYRPSEFYNVSVL